MEKESPLEAGHRIQGLYYGRMLRRAIDKPQKAGMLSIVRLL